MKLLSLPIFMLFCLNVFAGGNVALYTNLENIKFQNKASNHSNYFELQFRGTTSQSDAVVNGLPAQLPQTIRILFSPKSELDKISFNSCHQLAIKARQLNKQLRIDLFMENPDKLVDKIEGGMTDTRFNQFVIKTNDEDIESIGCEIN